MPTCFLLLSTIAFAPLASAAVLIDDTFTRTAGALNNTTPDTTVGGAKWVALSSASASTNGTGLSLATSFAQTAGLDLGAGYFATNKAIYDLSFDVSFPSHTTGATANWVSLGFAESLSTNGTMSPTTAVGGKPWFLYRENGTLSAYAGTGASNQVYTNASGAPNGSSYTLDLRLDTTGAAWTLRAFVNSTELDLNGAAAGLTYTYATNPTAIRYVEMGTSNGGTPAPVATVDNFTLTAVPEPTAITLLAGLSFSGLAMRRRGRESR